jgi:hypothetical protein
VHTSALPSVTFFSASPLLFITLPGFELDCCSYHLSASSPRGHFKLGFCRRHRKYNKSLVPAFI